MFIITSITLILVGLVMIVHLLRYFFFWLMNRQYRDDAYYEVSIELLRDIQFNNLCALSVVAVAFVIDILFYFLGFYQ